jgi:hypothetical protein
MAVINVWNVLVISISNTHEVQVLQWLLSMFKCVSHLVSNTEEMHVLQWLLSMFKMC